MKKESNIYFITQAIAAIFLQYNIPTIPVNTRFINNKTILDVLNNKNGMKNLLTNLQIMLYNWEIQHQKKHPYNKILTDFYFKWWKLKKTL